MSSNNCRIDISCCSNKFYFNVKLFKKSTLIFVLFVSGISCLKTIMVLRKHNKVMVRQFYRLTVNIN